MMDVKTSLKFSTLFFVPISKTGRIVIPKKIRERMNLDKGDNVLYIKRHPGYLWVGRSSFLYKVETELGYPGSESGMKNYVSDQYGISVIEENYRVFIPKKFRVFASIEDERKELNGEVALNCVQLYAYLEIWNKKLLLIEIENFYRTYFVELDGLREKLSLDEEFFEKHRIGYFEPFYLSRVKKLNRSTFKEEKEHLKKQIDELKRRIKK